MSYEEEIVAPEEEAAIIIPEGDVADEAGEVSPEVEVA